MALSLRQVGRKLLLQPLFLNNRLTKGNDHHNVQTLRTDKQLVEVQNDIINSRNGTTSA